MRYSLLLDREDLDTRGVNERRNARGRDGPNRLRRMESFRESPGGEWSRRQELRERMLELRRLRDINRREGAGARPILDIERGRPYSPFRHSSQSEFVPVRPSNHGAEESDHAVLDIVGPPERSGGDALLDSDSAPDTGEAPVPSQTISLRPWRSLASVDMLSASFTQAE